MKAKEIEALERYFTTENVHWNGHALQMLCEVMQQGNFENPETPLQLFDKAINIFTELHNTPLKAIQEFETEIDKQKLTPSQKLFVSQWAYKYVKVSAFEEIDFYEIKDLLLCQTKRFKSEIPKVEYKKPLTANIRDILKEIIQTELELLPDTLKKLEPLHRLNVLCKLIPYVLPKIESVIHSIGEPGS